jgi:hypothetical protein
VSHRTVFAAHRGYDNSREEHAMSARQIQRQPARACNDNGLFLALREHNPVRPLSVVRLAIDLGGSIWLTYLADGVLIIAPATEDRSHQPREVA